jgi:predicted dehydrogenase
LKVLIVGYGSIGKRHTNNLMSIGNIEIIICTKNKEAFQLEKKGIKIFNSLKNAVNEKPDISIICNETSLHVQTAIKLAKNGSHLFIEKPFSNSLKNIKELQTIVKKKKLITMVGCNMRFHDGIKLMKKSIIKNEIGRIFSVIVENGSFMPDWHPWEDYRNSYASKKQLGGGVVLTQIHEIDYLYWFFGKVDEVFSFTDKISDLQLDVEDYSGSLLKFKNKIITELHLDYFQKPNVRTCKIIGTKGKIIWDWNNNHLQIFKNNKNKFVTKHIDKKYDRNKMYIQELQYFINCVKKKQTSMNNVAEAYEIQKIALAIKNSSKSGKKVLLK